MRSRNGQVIRQWQLLRLLATRPHRVPELARASQVTRRTIYRDLDALRQAGFLVSQRQDGFWFSAPPHFSDDGAFLEASRELSTPQAR